MEPANKKDDIAPQMTEKDIFDQKMYDKKMFDSIKKKRMDNVGGMTPDETEWMSKRTERINHELHVKAKASKKKH